MLFYNIQRDIKIRSTRNTNRERLHGRYPRCNQLEYKRYQVNVEIDFQAEQFYGEITGMPDFVDFMSDIGDGIPGIVREYIVCKSGRR